MRRIRPDDARRRERGVTLIEMIIAMVIVGIIVAATLFFANPVRQATDQIGRASCRERV